MLRFLKSNQNRISWKLLIAGVIVGISTPWIYYIFLGLSIDNIINIGVKPIILVSSLIIIRLLLQGLRFYILLKASKVSFQTKIHECITIRVGSEFIAATSLSYIGDEIFRIGYLVKRGLDSGRAIWISYSETFYDVFIGTSINIVAAIDAFIRGDAALAFLLLTIALPILLFYLTVFLSAFYQRGIPRFLDKILSKLDRHPLFIKIVNWLKTTYESFSSSVKYFHSSVNKKLLIITILLTIVLAVIYGLSVYLIYSASGIKLSFYQSLLAVYSGTALGTLPITLGGSGTTELGVSLFVHSLTGEWAGQAVVAWRLATHITTLIITFICLLLSIRFFIKKEKT